MSRGSPRPSLVLEFVESYIIIWVCVGASNTCSTNARSTTRLLHLWAPTPGQHADRDLLAQHLRRSSCLFIGLAKVSAGPRIRWG